MAVDPDSVAAIKRRLGLIQRNVRDALNGAMDDAAEEVLSLSNDLAPQDSGDMIDPENAGVDKETTRDTFRRSVFYLLAYAVWQHEEFFNPGLTTAAKPRAGRKFLQRAFNERGSILITKIGREIERTLRITLR